MRSAWMAMVVLMALTGCGDRRSLDDFVAGKMPTSGTVMAANGGRIQYCKGFGMADREARIAATCDTVYDVMSITKQFTSAAVLKLEDQGKLRVSDPITRFLGNVPADKRKVTVQQLLDHTSGLVEGVGEDYDPVSKEAMLAKVLASNLDGMGRFRYSNAGYSVLAAVIEQVSGLSYERYLAKYLFGPAGMRRTGYVLPRWNPREVAVEYDNRGVRRGRPYEHPWAADGPHWNLRGNGGMLSTARDMFLWHRALTGTAVLSQRAKAELFTPRVALPSPMDKESYGYGWVVKDGFVWHDGGNDWSLAVFGRSTRDDTGVFWVSNHAYQQGKWNLEDVQDDLTQGIAARSRGGDQA